MAPNWISKINDMHKARVAHAFILHGNVGDYVTVPLRIGAYLSEAYKNSVFVQYSLAGGVKFRSPAERKRVMDLIGGDQAGESNDLLASFQATLGISAAPESAQRDADGAVIKMPADQALDLLYRIAIADAENGKPLAPVILIHAGDMLVPPASKATMPPADRLVLAKLAGWGIDSSLDEAGPRIFMTTRMLTEIHPDILAASSKWESIEIPMPDADARRSLIDRVLSDGKLPLGEGVTAAKIANMTAGLSLVHVEDVILTAQREGSLTLEIVSDRKRSILNSELAGMLETYDFLPTLDDYGEDAGEGDHGLAYYMNKWVALPLQNGDKDACARGVLLTGPSGTGKTFLAMCTAGSAKVSFAVLKLSGIVSKWVGEGQQNFAKALSAVSSLGKSILLIDEIDQLFRRGGDNSSQQDAAMFQMLLKFLEDPKIRGEVVVIAATNRPDMLDAALKRSGRFSKKIPVLPPGPGARKQIIKLKSDKYMCCDIDVATIDEAIIAATDGWTGAELEDAVMSAAEAMSDGETDDPLTALRIGLDRVIPTTSEIEFMTNLAIADCNDTRLLPARYRPRAKDKTTLEKKIKDQTPTERKARRTDD